MKFKKLALTLGSIVTVAAPVAAVISCGTSDASKFSEDEMLKMSNLKSTEAHSKLQDLWLAKVLKNAYGIDAQTFKLDDKGKEVVENGKAVMVDVEPMDILRNLDNTTTSGKEEFEGDFKDTLKWVLGNKLFASKDALSSIYQSLKSNAPDEVINTTPTSGVEKDIVKNLDAKVFDRSEIETKIKAIIDDDDWKDIFYNFTVNDKNEDIFNPSILGVKDLVLKMMVTKKYLSLSKKDFKGALPEEYAKIDSKYKDSSLVSDNAGFFPLVVSTMNSRLAYKTSIELTADKSKQFIISNIDNNLAVADVNKVFNSADSKFASKATYTIKSETIVKEINAKAPTYQGTDTFGFKGLSSLPTGKDALNTGTVSSIKLVKDSGARDGFVVVSKTGTKIITDSDIADSSVKPEDKYVRFTDEDKTKVEVNHYTSLMPTYDDVAKTLNWDSSVLMPNVNMDILMNEAYTKDSSLYSTAIKYFVSDIKDGDTVIHAPILIKVTNDWARNYYIDEGLTYIDDEK